MSIKLIPSNLKPLTPGAQPRLLPEIPKSALVPTEKDSFTPNTQNRLPEPVLPKVCRHKRAMDNIKKNGKPNVLKEVGRIGGFGLAAAAGIAGVSAGVLGVARVVLPTAAKIGALATGALSTAWSASPVLTSAAGVLGIAASIPFFVGCAFWLASIQP